MRYHVMHHSFEVVILGATEYGARWDHNTHRVVIESETITQFVGWPDPTDKRNSEHWQPGVSQPLVYLKYAWKRRS